MRSGAPVEGETRPTQFWVACSAWVPRFSTEAIDKPEAYSEDGEDNTGEKADTAATKQPLALAKVGKWDDKYCLGVQVFSEVECV